MFSLILACLIAPTLLRSAQNVSQADVEEIVKKIEKGWKAYKANNKLDLYGKPENGIANRLS